MKIVLIDDESKSRSLLKNILSDHKKNHYTFYEADSLKDGIAILKKEQPQLVFLDIDMPTEQGIEIDKYLNTHEQTFELVFATAYSDFALKAFELNASDYIMKPFRPKQVVDLVEKVEKLWHQRDLHKHFEDLKHNLFSESIQKIAVPAQEGIIFLKPNDIIRLEADGMYTKVYTINKAPIYVSKPLKFFIPSLESHGNFFRSHRSHMVNLNYLIEYVRKDGHYLILENNDLVPLSKERKETFLQQLLKV